jgi:hypothetical protein
MGAAETESETKPKRRGGPRRKRVGVFSRGSAIRRVDGRTVEARIVTGITAELIDQLGGERVTAAQRLLIAATATIALRLRAATERYASGDPVDQIESLDRHVAALTNSLRLNLVTLGLERVEHQPRTLATYLEARRERPAA